MYMHTINKDRPYHINIESHSEANFSLIYLKQLDVYLIHINKNRLIDRQS